MSDLLAKIVEKDSKLAFYIRELKPFIDKYKKENGDKFPTWEVIDKNFNDKFGKKTAAMWFKALLDKYNKQFTDAEHTKTNKFYNADIAAALKARYDFIKEATGKKRGNAIDPFSEDMGKEIAELL